MPILISLLPLHIGSYENALRLDWYQWEKQCIIIQVYYSKSLIRVCVLRRTKCLKNGGGSLVIWQILFFVLSSVINTCAQKAVELLCFLYPIIAIHISPTIRTSGNHINIFLHDRRLLILKCNHRGKSETKWHIKWGTELNIVRKIIHIKLNPNWIWLLMLTVCFVLLLSLLCMFCVVEYFSTFLSFVMV